MRQAVRSIKAGASLRLLVINPNSNAQVTDQVRGVAGRVLWPGVVADVVNPVGTPRSIETVADRRAAEPKVIELIQAGAEAGYAGFVLACFDDIAVEATRGRVGAPVVCAVEASLALARSFARRFAIVTTFEAAVPRISELVRRYGFDSSCSVRAAGIGVAAAASFDGEVRNRIAAEIERAVSEDGAEAVILGSGGLAGHGSALAQPDGVPIIDSIGAAIAFCATAARLDSASPVDLGARSVTQL